MEDNISTKVVIFIMVLVLLSGLLLSTTSTQAATFTFINTNDSLDSSINTHWFNWATTFEQYQEKIKRFKFVRDHVWWSNLEPVDYTDDQQWNDAPWSYSVPDLYIQNCDQYLAYQSGYDELVKKFQSPDSPELLLLLNIENENLDTDPNNISANQYYDYIYHVVERYDGDGFMDMPGLVRPVKYFEIGNEVDLPEYGKGLTLNNYVIKRLIPAYFAAKKANLNAVILNAGLSMMKDRHFDITYLWKMLSLIKILGGEKNGYYMDAIAIHYYCDPQDPERFQINYPIVKFILKLFGIDSKPVWITEYGLATMKNEGGEIREEDQASVLLRFAILMKYYGISESFIYNLKDVNSSDPSDWENVLGLHKVVCQDTSEIIQEKQAMPVLAIFSNKTNGLNFENINPSLERLFGIHKLIFGDGTKKLQILWYTKFNDTGINPDHSSETTQIQVSLDGNNGVLIDMYGNIINSNIADGTVITIGEKPQYIEY